jgi:hypothetical protein
VEGASDEIYRFSSSLSAAAGSGVVGGLLTKKMLTVAKRYWQHFRQQLFSLWNSASSLAVGPIFVWIPTAGILIFQNKTRQESETEERGKREREQKEQTNK